LISQRFALEQHEAAFAAAGRGLKVLFDIGNSGDR
jgi:hypothetical protein